MSKSLQAIRGMNDCLPTDTRRWQKVESVLRSTVAQYGYDEIRTPILESTDLFKRSIGEVTDIVEKEMYTFLDRNGDSLTLRPEGTASTVRAGNEHGLLYNQQQRLWYMGPMFRHERPQKGRYRQFHQFGVETYGIASADIDAEVIAMSARLWQTFGMADKVTLQLNSLGQQEAREAYKAALVDYLSANKGQLDEDSLRRLDTNPLRILDSKNPQVQALLTDAPVLTDYLSEEDSEHFSSLCERLAQMDIEFEVNPRLVRGLDYYNRTVFEWVTGSLGAQGTICAGGRYDTLVEQLGGKATPAVGFALGIERLVLLLDVLGYFAEQSPACDVYIASTGKVAEPFAMNVSESLRDVMPHIRFMHHCGGGAFKKQLKRADKQGAAVVIMVGDDEANHHQVTIKHMRNLLPQVTVDKEDCAKTLDTYLSAT